MCSTRSSSTSRATRDDVDVEEAEADVGVLVNDDDDEEGEDCPGSGALASTQTSPPSAVAASLRLSPDAPSASASVLATTVRGLELGRTPFERARVSRICAMRRWTSSASFELAVAGDADAPDEAGEGEVPRFGRGLRPDGPGGARRR